MDAAVVSRTLLMFHLAQMFLLPDCVDASFFGGERSDRIRLRDIDALTLNDGEYTIGRKAAAVPQLSCVGGTAWCWSFRPKVAQCYNRGWDGADVQWECKADMSNGYKFGRMAVSCEGYDFAEDENVVVGSCGLQYELDTTGLRERWSAGEIALIVAATAAVVVTIGWCCYRPGDGGHGRRNYFPWWWARPSANYGNNYNATTFIRTSGGPTSRSTSGYAGTVRRSARIAAGSKTTSTSGSR